MKIFARGAFSLALIAAAAGLASAAEVTGVLMDVACSSDTAKDGYKGALDHTKDCALMAPCVKSGYGVVTEDGKFIKFDKAGNEKALALLNKTDKTDHLKIAVSG